MSEPKYKVGDRVRVLPVEVLSSQLHWRVGTVTHVGHTSTHSEDLFSLVLDGDEQKTCGLRACEIEPAPPEKPPVQSADGLFKSGDEVRVLDIFNVSPVHLRGKIGVVREVFQDLTLKVRLKGETDWRCIPQNWVELTKAEQDQSVGSSSPTPWYGVPDHIAAVCNDLRDLLLAKNKAYGNSALDPVRIFSKADPIEQLNVRIDDKLSRLVRGQDAGEDVELDLLGYLVLKQVAKRLKNEQNAPTE